MAVGLDQLVGPFGEIEPLEQRRRDPRDVLGVPLVEVADELEELARCELGVEEGAVGGELPTLNVPEGSISIVRALTGLGFAASNGEARRKIDEGAVKLDGITVSDPQLVVTVGDTPLKVSLGKKKHGLLAA